MSHGTPRFSLASITLAAAVFAIGCGGSGSAVSDEEQAIQTLVADVSDASFDQAGFANLYVPGNVPPDTDRNRFRVYMYRTKSIEITDQTATAMVEIEHGASGDILGEFEWKAQKSNGSWKLSATPLPPL